MGPRPRPLRRRPRRPPLVRPQVIVATFLGGVTDGHGQHQVSGEIAQEVFKAAGDPNVFPEQLKDGPPALAAARRLLPRSLRPHHRARASSTTPPASGPPRASTTTSPASGQPALPPPTQSFPSAPGTRSSAAAMCRSRARAGASRNRKTAAQIPPSAAPPHPPITSGPSLLQPQQAGSASDASLFDNPKVKINTSIQGLARPRQGHSSRMAFQWPPPNRSKPQAIRERLQK